LPHPEPGTAPGPATGTRIPGGISPGLFGSVGGGTIGFFVPVVSPTPTTCGSWQNGECTEVVVTASRVWVSLTSGFDIGSDGDFFSGMPDSYACLGVSEIGGASVCRANRSGNLYLEVGAGLGSPINFSFGKSPNADAYLSGFSISGNGFPGAGASFNSTGVSGWAVQSGFPGFGATYGINLNSIYNGSISNLSHFANTFAGGFVNMYYPGGH
jgi:hypothetical protein